MSADDQQVTTTMRQCPAAFQHPTKGETRCQRPEGHDGNHNNGTSWWGVSSGSQEQKR